MDKIKLITDGSCDLSDEVLNKFNINVVPLGVSFGEEHYTAGVDIDNKTFYAKMKESTELPKTFCPSSCLRQDLAYQRPWQHVRLQDKCSKARSLQPSYRNEPSGGPRRISGSCRSLQTHRIRRSGTCR